MIKINKTMFLIFIIVLALLIMIKMFLNDPLGQVKVFLLVLPFSIALGIYISYSGQEEKDKTMFLICVIYFFYLVYYYTIRYVIAFFMTLYCWVKTKINVLRQKI